MFALGAAALGTRLCLPRLRIRAGLLGCDQCLLGGSGHGSGSSGCMFGCNEIGLRPLHPLAAFTQRSEGIGRFGRAALQCLAAVRYQTPGRLMARGQLRQIFRLRGQIGFAVFKHLACLARGLCCGTQLAVMALGRAFQCRLFRFKAVYRIARIAVQLGLPPDIPRKLRDPGLQRFDPCKSCLFLIGNAGLLNAEPLKDRGGDRFFLAKGRQGLLRLCPRAGPVARRHLGICGGGYTVAQIGTRRCLRHVRFVPAQIEQHPFRPAQIGCNGAIARRLPCLARQCRQLGCQLIHRITDARQVILRSLQLQLRLVAALVEARNASRLLKNAAAGPGSGVDQFGNLPLPDQRRRMRPGRGIREQHLHIARAYIAPVHAVGAAHIAGNAAHDLDLIGIIEPRRRQPIRVVDMDRHLGKGARTARRCPGKDHVLHPAAAHRRGAVFAHHPAQRLQQVGFAAPVGPHNAGQPVADDQIGRVDKAFEAGQSEP